LLVAGKARAAEALVCEASKDDYYSMNKSNPHSAEVRTVTLSPDLKSAKAVVSLEDVYPIGFENKLVKMPMPSNWKLEAGQWCYYLAPDTDELDTPFGKMNLKRGDQGKTAGDATAPAAAAVDPAKLPAMVAFSKHEISLPYDADGKDEIVVSNGLSGPIQLRLACPDVAGLVCKMDRSYIAAGQKGKLLVDFKFKDAKIAESAAVTLWVLPFDSMATFPIHRLSATPKP